jgi:hypothetical protein
MEKESEEVLRGFGFLAGAPLEIDFGCHRGAFLIGMAALHPGSKSKSTASKNATPAPNALASPMPAP